VKGRGRVVGIDIGGTKIAVAAIDGTGELVREAAIPTEPERGFASGISRITDAVTRVVEESGWSPREIHGIGIGCAGPVDPARGTIHNPYTLPGWQDGDIVTALREAFGCPVLLENDADMALLGECGAGAGRGVDPVVMLTFGTGIGGAALVGGAILRGVAGEHPELGHVPVDPRGPACYCGTNGCFESLASGSALAARGNLPEALSAVGAAIWTIVHALLPERIVLGGGVMDTHYDAFAAAASQAIGRAKLAPPGRVTVARARLGNRAGLFGAASAVINRRSED
jgi:glucokinase